MNVKYLTAEEEDTHHIAQANARIDDKGNFLSGVGKRSF